MLNIFRRKPRLPFAVYERRRIVTVKYRTRLVGRTRSGAEAAALARVLAGDLDAGADVVIVPFGKPGVMLVAAERR